MFEKAGIEEVKNDQRCRILCIWVDSPMLRRSISRLRAIEIGCVLCLYTSWSVLVTVETTVNLRRLDCNYMHILSSSKSIPTLRIHILCKSSWTVISSSLTWLSKAWAAEYTDWIKNNKRCRILCELGSVKKNLRSNLFSLKQIF